MKKWFLLLLFPIFMGAGLPSKTEEASSSIVFFKGTLKDAQEKAAREGKMVFIDFYASWCAPCKLMDEYTFTDPEVARDMRAKYVPVKMNIDDFDGFEYKQQYNINLLPTLLLTDCKGREIVRKEEGLVPTTLRSFLKNNFSSAHLCAKPKPKPSKPEPPKPVVVNPTPSPKPSSRPTKPTLPPVKPTKPTVKPIKPQVTSKPTPAVPKPQVSNTGEITVGEGLFRFAVQRQPSKGYSIQTGAFGEYGNVLKEVDKLQRIFTKSPIIVYIQKRGVRTIYKVLVGEFDARAKAQTFKESMKNRGIPGLVKNLEQMK